MYAVTISFRAINEASVEQLRQACIDVVKSSLEEEKCLFFDVLFDESDPLSVRFYEAYQDREAFDWHLQTAHAQQWSKICLPLIDRSSIRMPESVSTHQ